MMKKKTRFALLLVSLLLTLATFHLPAAATGPIVNGTVALSPALTDLTAEGIRDWGHWGYGGALTYHHKAGVASAIAYNIFGPAAFISPVGARHQWNDGTPLMVASTDSGTILSNVGAYFQVWTSASTTHRKMRIYVGVCGTATMTAYLTDGSAPAYNHTATGNGVPLVYEFEFASAGAGKFVMEWKVQNTNCTLAPAGAALQAASLF